MSQDKPVIQIQNASNRMVRSPSHESIEVSLLSLSNLDPFARIPSPIHRLTVPSANENSPRSIWESEETDLVKNFGTLFKFLGSKSFSTSDISTARDPPIRKSSSELDLNHTDVIFRIPSRSCSTRVFVGDVPSTSQLPSPTPGRLGTFTPADLIRSVNKKVRQLYIRKRLSLAYKLTQSGFDIANIVKPQNITSGGGGISTKSNTDSITNTNQCSSEAITTNSSLITNLDGSNVEQVHQQFPKKFTTKQITIKDVERDRGRPLSKLERNIFIFNWLHSLDENYDPLLE